MSHTPGPWKAAQPKHDPQAWDVCTESGGVLAKLPWGGEGGANAMLMAAAPELLAALERSLNWLASYPGGGASNAWVQARKAIIKATEPDTSDATNCLPEGSNK